MGEVFFCQECHQRVDLLADEYTIPNRATARTKAQWVYSHAKCVENREAEGPISTPAMQELLSRMLDDHLAAKDDAALRRLGLQRIADP